MAPDDGCGDLGGENDSSGGSVCESVGDAPPLEPFTTLSERHRFVTRRATPSAAWHIHPDRFVAFRGHRPAVTSEFASNFGR